MIKIIDQLSVTNIIMLKICDLFNCDNVWLYLKLSISWDSHFSNSERCDESKTSSEQHFCRETPSCWGQRRKGRLWSFRFHLQLCWTEKHLSSRLWLHKCMLGFNKPKTEIRGCRETRKPNLDSWRFPTSFGLKSKKSRGCFRANWGPAKHLSDNWVCLSS